MELGGKKEMGTTLFFQRRKEEEMATTLPSIPIQQKSLSKSR
jgi:hypothetical protein